MFSFDLWLSGLKERLPDLGDVRHDWLTWANIVTYVRLVGTGVFLWMALDHSDGTGWRLGMALLFVAIAATDKLDGWLARHFNQVTELGKFMDPLVDKVLVIPALVVLCLWPSPLRELVIWTTAFMVAREVHVTWKLRMTKTPIAAIKSGKWKMAMQVAMITALIMPLSGWFGAGWWVHIQMATIILASALTGFSWGDYYARFVVMKVQEQAPEPELEPELTT